MMKRFLLFLTYIIFISSQSALSQVTTESVESDTTSTDEAYAGNTLLKGLVIDMGTAYIPNADAFGVPGIFNVKTGRPSTANIYLYRKIKITKRYLSFAPGIGLGLDNYFFEKDLLISPTGDSLFSVDDSNLLGIRKTKLSANYVDVPLEIIFSSKPNYKKALKIAVGGKFGILFSGKSKLKYEINGEDVKQKQSDKSLNPIRYGITARLGYGLFNVFGYYSLSPLFKDKYAPEVTPIIVGVSLASF